jgi:hypothetical protein
VAATRPRVRCGRPRKSVRRCVASLIVASLWTGPALAQEQDRSLERISIALQRPSPVLSRLPAPESPGPPTKLGIFTLLPPTGRGEIVRVSIPIGELVSRAFKSVSEANRRRQEATSRRKVEADLQAFAQQRQPE